MTPIEAIAKAADLAGGQSALAKTINVKAPTLNQWVSGKRPIPPARAVAIEKAVNGQVSKSLLCPNFPWSEPLKSVGAE